MRKETYLCDSCGREFGSQAHINVKNTQVFISHQNQRKEWKTTAITAPCREHHFCNCQCVAEWLNPKVKEVLAKLTPKEGPYDVVNYSDSNGS